MISNEAIEAAHKAWREQAKQDGSIFEYNLRAAIEAAYQQVVDAVLDISNIRMDSEHGDPTFVAGWEAALEEVNARIGESSGGSDNE